MMNDYQNNNYQDSRVDELINQLQNLKEENLFLKEEVRRLNASVTGLNSARPELRNEVINSPLVEYYISRYNEIHEYVLENRLNVINEEIKKAEEAYTLLTSREESLEEIALKNQTLQSQINELEELIEENNSKLQASQEVFEQEAEVVTDLENNIYTTTINYYNNLLSKLSVGDSTETREYVNFLMDVLKYTLYDEVIKYLNKAKKALNYLDELTVLEYEIKNENNQYLNEKEALAEGIEVISFEETEKRLDELAYEVSTKRVAKDELNSLFEQLKKENIKQIKDEIKHLQILEYNNQQIALKMDDIVLNYKRLLASADTTSNILFNKKSLLQKLTEELEKITPYKEEYERLNTEYVKLQDMYQTITTNIEDIENFTENTKKILDSSMMFRQTVREYDEIRIKKDAVKMELDTVLLREKNLAETRKQILNDPYGKTDLIKLDEELKDVQSSISFFNSELIKLDSRIYRLKETEQDYKLITIYEEFELCEKELPSLYDKQRTLATMISDKYVEVSNAKTKSANFEELRKQVEEISNEINNL